jgi:FkbM family methyltransferase
MLHRLRPSLNRGVNRSLGIVGLELRRVPRPDAFGGIWERNARDQARMRTILAALLGPADRCVDGGANRGDVTEWFVNFAPLGEHIAIEPIPHLAGEAALRFPSVEVRCAALGERTGRADFTYFPGAPALSGFGARACALPSETIEVEVVTLDDVVGDRRIDFVKLDLEGHELQALLGARRTLREFMPVVVFEHCRISFGEDGKPLLGAPDYGATESIYALLVDELGYRIFDLDGTGPLRVEQFRHVYETAHEINFLARP